MGQNERIIRFLAANPRTPVVLAVNKVDLSGSKNKILAVIDQFTKKLKVVEVVPVSARSGINTEKLTMILENLLPEAPPLYPDDMLTDRSERFITQEIIREKIISLTEDEVPHNVAVEIEEYKSPDEYPERKDLFIRATVYVNRSGQKAIILGKKGEKIKAIGSEARKVIEEITGHKTFLELWVKVNNGWINSESELKKLGYE